MSTCYRPGCFRSCYPGHNFCGQTCARMAGALIQPPIMIVAHPVNVPTAIVINSSYAPVCALWGCGRACAGNGRGGFHNYCGRAHAIQAGALRSAPIQAVGFIGMMPVPMQPTVVQAPPTVVMPSPVPGQPGHQMKPHCVICKAMVPYDQSAGKYHSGCCYNHTQQATMRGRPFPDWF
jgi:hypothetical protein